MSFEFISFTIVFFWVIFLILSIFLIIGGKRALQEEKEEKERIEKQKFDYLFLTDSVIQLSNRIKKVEDKISKKK